MLIRKVFADAKIKRDYRYLTHSLRHTFASQLVQKGVPSKKYHRGWGTPTSKPLASTRRTLPFTTGISKSFQLA